MKNNLSKLTAIVLAGGKSSRMGKDKALIPIQGTPLLQKVCSIAQSCADTVYIITPCPESYQHLILPNCHFIQEISTSEFPDPHSFSRFCSRTISSANRLGVTTSL